MLSTGEEIRSPQRSSRSGPILAKMPCTIVQSPTWRDTVPVSNLFKVGRQLNFLSYLGRNEKIILIFRRDARVTFRNVMRAPRR